MLQRYTGRLVYALICVLLVAVIGRNVYRRYQSAALFRAAIQGDTARLRSLLAQGVDVNTVNRYETDNWGKVQESPLLLAANARQWEAVHLLLQAGADASFHNGAQSSLSYAIQNENLDMVRELLQHHADPNLMDTSGSPLLFSAFATKNGSIIRALVEAGADPNAIDSQGNTALYVAANASYPILNADKNFTRLNLLQLLVKHGADVNARRAPNKCTPLMSAVLGGNKEIVQFLLAHGASPNEKTLPGSAGTSAITALSLAREYKHPEIASLLVQAGAKE